MSKEPKPNCSDDHLEQAGKLPSIMKSPLGLNLYTSPFDKLAISDATRILSDNKERERCRSCGRSRMWFCYECRQPIGSLRGLLPHVQLPFAVDIIKHRKELDSKSTGVHAAILSTDVAIYTYPTIPDYDPERVLLMFPDGLAFENVCSDSANEGAPLEKCKLCDDSHRKFPFDKIILIDSTWAQTKRIILDERVSILPHRASLSGRESVFWRPQRNENSSNLATIEAIHHTCWMWLSAQNCHQRAKVDNLLFFFKYMHEKISSRCRTLSMNVNETI